MRNNKTTKTTDCMYYLIYLHLVNLNTTPQVNHTWEILPVLELKGK